MPKPRVGGIAVFFGFAFALFTVLGLSQVSPFALLPSADQFDAIHKLVGLLFGSLLILGVGIWDDVMQMRPRNKLVAQIVVALISMLYGFVIPGITVPSITIRGRIGSTFRSGSGMRPHAALVQSG